MNENTQTAHTKPKVLVVDDVSKNIQVLAGVLGSHNYVVSAAMNGQQALLIAEKVLPDLILLDVTMPEIDGFEVCKRLKANPSTKHIPIIFLTARTETEDIVKGFQFGAVDYVTKPFQSEELLTRVRTHIDLKIKTEELVTMNQLLSQREEKYRGLYHSSIDAIILINMDYKIMDANPGAIEMSGYTLDELKSMSIWELSSAEFKEKIIQHAKSKMISHGYTDHYEKDMIKKDGLQIPVESRAWIARDDHGNIVGIWELTKDITYRKRSERLREDVERILRHDLRNLLSGIISTSQILKSYPTQMSTEKTMDFIALIYDTSMRMDHMMRHSLDIFKMEEGKYEFQPSYFNIVILLRNLDKQYANLRSIQSIQMDYQVNGVSIEWEEQYYIIGEMYLFENMMGNIIKNAIEASPPDQTVTVSIQQIDNTHSICVHNFGVVPEEIRDSFFEKYTTKNKKYGTGIGTYSAMLIAKTHGGSIQMETSETDGTRVTVLIPAQ